MPRQRTIVIGDIHGCLEEFDELLQKVEYRREHDRLILAGDLVDRGPDSAGVVRRAMEIGAEAVMGNHDEWNVLYRRQQASGEKNSMRLKKDARITQETLGEAEWAWLEKLPYYLHIDNKWSAVHAGCLPGNTVENQDKEILLRVRFVRRATMERARLDEEMTNETHAFWTQLWRGPRSIVYGHYPEKRGCVLTTVFCAPPDEREPEQRCMIEGRNGSVGDGYAVTIGIDTGCCFGGRLSAVILTRRGPGLEADTGTEYEIVSVPARAKYAKLRGEDA